MKKIITGLFLMACCCYNYGQTSLTFCTSVEQTGYCNFSNNKFIAQQDSTTSKIFMQVRSSAPGVTIGASKVTYKIYSVNAKGEETMVTSVDQSVQPDWLFAWSPYNFKAGAKYNVKVYNELNQLMCYKSLELISW